MASKRASSLDCFKRRKLWQQSCQRPVQGSPDTSSSSCHKGPPQGGGLDSRASEMSSMSVSLIESFDQDSPVFVGSEERRIRLNTKIDSQLEDETSEEERMHEKLKEQWSAGSAERSTKEKVSLRRKRALSASCPSLDGNAALSVTSPSAADSHLLVEIEDDGMLHRSMHNLSNPVDSMAPSSSSVPSSLPIGLRVSSETDSPADSHRSTSPFPEISVQICINDVSVDNPEDYHQQMGSEDEEDINLELIRRQKRRSSWCPEQERKKDEKEEKQRMLGINGRSQSLSSLEGQDDTDDSDDDDSTHSTHVNMPSKSFAHVTLLNDSDIDGNTDLVYTDTPSLGAGGFWKCPSEERKQGKDLSTRRDSDDDISKRHRSLINDMDSNDERTTLRSCHRQYRSEMHSNDRTSAKEEYITTKFVTAQSVAVRAVEGCSAEDLTNATCPTSPRTERSRSPSEEKTRRRSSVFSKISSYRQNKKVVKGSKFSRNCHQFVSVSVSNSTACDVCGKFLSNKPALQCENCAINVHESSCVDQTQSCARNNHRVPSKEESAYIKREANRVEDENGIDFIDGFTKSIIVGLSSAHSASHSTESLEETSMTLVDVEDETEMVLMAEMAEAWSVTVDKKTLKKMTAKDIKRQDHIWELIATEKNHYRTLKTMQKIFAHGMKKEVGMSRENIDQIFPRLEELIEVHSIILKSFVESQEVRVDHCIEHIGPLLVQLFSGQTGNEMRSAYGEFCSRHAEAVGIYKELRRTDKKFQTFIDKCSHRNVCRRLGVDECILLVTQRLTKYPLLIDPIIKTTIDVQERQLLNNALSLIKSIINSVNAQIDEYAKCQRLTDILNRLDQKSSTIFRGSKFKKFELLVSDRKLHYEGYVKWMSARGKSCEVLAVVLSDILFFLTESNQKYYFFSQDGKSSVVSLSKLLVREKDDMRDSRGFYLICSSDEPEMYELICKSTEERSHWIALLKDAIFKCSQDDVSSQATSSMNGFISSDSSAPKIQQLLEILQEKDRKIAMLCKEKTRIILEMLEAIDHRDEKTKLNENETFDPSHLINAVLQLETRLLVAVKQINAMLSQTADLAGCSSEADSAAQPKKRAETFSGFEHKDKEPTERRRNASGYCNRKDSSSSSGSIQNGSNEIKSLSSGEQPNDTKAFRRASLVISSSLMDTYRSSNNSEKPNRRMSVNLLPNMLNKLHREKETIRPLVTSNQTASGKADEWIAPLPVHAPPPLSSDFLSTLVTDQCESLAQIAHHVCSLMSFITKQSTELQSHRVELSGMNQNVSKLFRENDRLQNDRRLTGFQHDKQLEELRNLQTSIEKQKKELHKFRAEQEAKLQLERDKLQKKQDDIDRQRAELKNQKDELQRQKDTLQRQFDLFEERLSTFRSLSLSTHQSERTQSLGARAMNSLVPAKPSGSLILYSHDSSKAAPEIPDVTGKGTSTGEILHKAEVPVHMPSTANETRLAPAKKRFSSSECGRPKGSSPPTPVQQVLPMKLSTRGGYVSANDAQVEKPSVGISKNFSESCIGAGANVGTPPSGPSFYPNLYASRSQPQINSPISAIPQHVKSNILPMKLAGKSKSTPSSAHNSPTRSVPTSGADFQSSSAEKHMQKKRIKEESEIIYF